jgi:uncharacterized protein (DUF736 family)
MRYVDKQSIIEAGNELCKHIEELEQHVHYNKRNKYPHLNAGKYRIIFNGAKVGAAYGEDRTAAQGLLRLLRWYDLDHPDRTGTFMTSIIVTQPGEPDTLIATYYLFPTGRIVRQVEQTQRRQTVDWGREL